jgi:DNA modification methylase
MGRSDYHYRHETILYGWRDGAAHYFRTERTEDTILNRTQAGRIKDLDAPALRALIKDLRRELRDTTWHEDKPSASADHPTTKPLGLITKAIRNSTRTGAHLFDGFSGSGGALIAAELTARAAHLIELEPRYVAVTLERARNAGLTPERTR